ncbi:capsular biosynthesis protein [Pradoshia sp. D12]|uniref:YveK family protein n=1 Tax=Bacillaceae TaxID=186817 RepID=UPI00112738B5|nr:MULTISPECIES: YveK family protein [Bacillaceae]QFK72936.1 capsular biosynthesis protein [Pradoshia sp. D12]TPF71928.1 capsular biosynthesis protein [Bacillus sp. D12]
MEETISLKDLFETLKKRAWFIIMITVLAVLISGVTSFFILTPIYQSSTQLLVNQAKGEETAYNYNEVQTNLQLIETYNVIMKSPAILDKVIEKLNLDLSAGELTNKITVASEQNSQVVNVSVTDEDPHMAAKIANTTAEIFKEEIVDIMNVDNVSILAKATVSENASPIKPQPLLNIAIAMVVGLMIGVGIAFLMDYLDNTIKTEQDIERILDLPIIGVIGVIETSNTQMESRARAKRSGRGEQHGA